MCPLMKGGERSQVSWTFTADDSESAHRARLEFTSYIRECKTSDDAVSESELIFGELIGNAVRHVGGQVRAHLKLQGRRPVLCVTDREAASHLEIAHRGPDGETGRGLLIVHALARRVWVERGPNAKTVCAELPCELSVRRSQERGELPA